MAFIAFEGIDGAGKSTLIAALKARLEARGADVLVAREPGTTAFGERLRALLLDPGTEQLQRWTEACLFTAARAEMLAQVIQPALEEGRTVLLDRFAYSTLAYQGDGLGLDLSVLEPLQNAAIGGRWPDRVFWLDLPLDVARGRRGEEEDRIEGRGDAFLGRVAAGFERMAAADPERFCRLDATLPAEQIADEALRHWPED